MPTIEYGDPFELNDDQRFTVLIKHHKIAGENNDVEFLAFDMQAHHPEGKAVYTNISLVEAKALVRLLITEIENGDKNFKQEIEDEFGPEVIEI